MSSSVFDQPLRLNIEPSVCWGRIRGFAHLAAAVGLSVAAYRLAAPWAYGVAALTPLLIPIYLQMRKAGRRWVGVVWMPGDELRVLSATGEERAARLEAGSFISPWLVILALRSGGRRMRLVICRDATDADAHRRLRVKLRGGEGVDRD